jgi:hypothetical protein
VPIKRLMATNAVDYTASGVVFGLRTGDVFGRTSELAGLDVDDPDYRCFEVSQWDGTTTAESKIGGVADPVLDNELVNLGTVQPLHAFVEVKAVASANVSLTTPPAQIDGVTLAEDDAVLLVAQGIGTQNGLYVFKSTATPLVRGTRYGNNVDMTAKFFCCFGGSVNANTCWTGISGIVGQDPIVISCFSVVGGKVNNTSVTITDGSITSSSGSLSFGSCNLTTTGNCNSSNFFSSSDRRLKTTLRPLTLPLTALDDIHGFRFNWRSGGRTDVGFMAQDVRALLPEVVSENEETGLLAVDYSRLVPLLLEWVRVLRDRARVIPDLMRQNESLALELKRLRTIL